MKEENVDTVFGYPGGTVIPLYDKLYNSDIRHILVCHEQGAVHAADGYARATGKTGVCIATSGPGATNLVTGIATSYMDSTPLVAITGQVRSNLIGKDSFQEVDIVGITMSIVKHSYIVKKSEELEDTLKEAFHIARTGRPGPVIVDIPTDILAGKIKCSSEDLTELKEPCTSNDNTYEEINKLMEFIMKSERPLLYIGGGVVSADACLELKMFAERFNIPIVTTLMAVTAIEKNHPFNFGMLGMHGTRYANHAVCNCDLLVAIGARFDDRATGDPAYFAKDAKKVQIDIDDAEINKIVKVDASVVGDAKKILKKFLEMYPGNSELPSREGWIAQLNEVKASHPLRYDEGQNLKPQYVIDQIFKLSGKTSIISTDVGEHQMWAAQYNTGGTGRSFLTSGGLGTMGFGVPAAIGAQAAHPDRPVFCISGDGSFQMNSQEIMTAVRYNLPIKVAIMNNGYLGMVRQWQELFYDKRYSFTDIKEQPDFVKLAEAYGAVGIRVTKKEDVAEAILKAIGIDKPVILDFVVEREENIYPFVPSGSTLDNVIGG